MGSEVPKPDQPKYKTIIEADKKVFEASRAKIKTPGTLPLEHDALRYMLIPPKLFEIVPDPDSLDIITFNNSSDTGFTAFVVSKTPLTSIIDDQNRTRILQPPGPYSDLRLQENYFVDQQIIDSGGVPLLYIHLAAENDQNLHLFSFDDRPELHELGIATSFYERLQNTARDLGFRFITGLCDTEEQVAFLYKRGSYFLDEIFQNNQQLFLDSIPDLDPEDYQYFFIDFLDPVDIVELVTSEALVNRRKQRLT